MMAGLNIELIPDAKDGGFTARLPRATGTQMVRFLQREGFALVRVRGSHHAMAKGELRTTGPVHGSRRLKIGTLRGILRDIRMGPVEFEKRWR